MRVLLLGTSYSSLPLLRELKLLNCEVIACGKYPDDPCHLYADRSIFVDYSDFEAVYSAVKDYSINAVVPSCSDVSYEVANKLAISFNCRGFNALETTLMLHTKNKFREILSDLSLPAPKIFSLDNLNNISYPCIVKPVDSFSGKGIKTVFSPVDLEGSINCALDASPSSQYVIEEFVEGTLHSHSAFISKGKVLQDFFVDEFCETYPYQVDCSNHPSLLSDSLKNLVRESILLLCQHLSLCDGLIHTQFISNGSSIWLIETMRRSPGDLYGYLVNKSTGFPYYKYYVAPFLGLQLASFSPCSPPKNIFRHTLSSDSVTSFTSVKLNQYVEQFEFFPLKLSGQLQSAAPFDKSGICFGQLPTLEELGKFTRNSSKHVRIII